jgi:hypothetical protein
MLLGTTMVATRRRSSQKLIVTGVAGCVLALGLGRLAVTHYGVDAAGAIIGLAFLGAAVATYMRDPILALIGLWLFVVFDAPISAVFGYNSATGQAIRQGDEVLVLLFVLLAIRRALLTNIKLPPARFIIPAVGVAACGVLGGIIHDVPVSITGVGALLGLKLWIMIGTTLLLRWTPDDLLRVYKTLITVGLVVAGLGLLDYLTHGAVSRVLHTSNYNVREGGYRSDAVHSIFPTPGEYSLFMSLLFAISFSRFANQLRRSDLVIALLFAASVMLSLRLKGILSLAAVIVIVGIAQGAINSRRSVAALLLGVLVAAGAYSVEGSVITKQVSTYTSSESSTRARLYAAGWEIADANFPLGVGFGRYASYPSRTSYSPVYYQYRLNGVYGLSPRYPDFIDDTSWPSVIGETGYGGFMFYVVGLLLVAAAIVGRLKIVPDALRWAPLAALCALVALLVDSLGDPTLFSWLGATTFAMILGPAMVMVRQAPPSQLSARGKNSAGPTPTEG